jgi:stage V sporulation protein B
MFILIIWGKFIAIDLFAEPDAAPVIASLAPSIPLLCIFGVMSSALRAARANALAAMLTALILIVYLLCTLIFFGVGYRDVSAPGYAYTISICVILFPAAYALGPKHSSAAPYSMRDLLSFGISAMFISGASITSLWTDRIVIGAMANASDVGCYQVASQIATAAVVVKLAIHSIFESRVKKDGSGIDMSEDFFAATRLSIHALVPGLMTVALTSNFWSGVLFGREYLAAAIPLTVLSWGQIIQILIGPSVSALQMGGGERKAMFWAVLGCSLNILGNIVLIPLFGLIGSAVATSVAISLVNGLCLRTLLHTHRLQRPFPFVVDPLVAVVASGIGTGIVLHLLGSGSWSSVLAALVVSYAIYGLVVLLFCKVEDEIVQYIWTRLRVVRERI